MKEEFNKLNKYFGYVWLGRNACFGGEHQNESYLILCDSDSEAKQLFLNYLSRSNQKSELFDNSIKCEELSDHGRLVRLHDSFRLDDLIGCDVDINEGLISAKNNKVVIDIARLDWTHSVSKNFYRSIQKNNFLYVLDIF